MARYITYKGEKKSMKAWAEELEIPYEVMRQRIKKGYSLEEIYDLSHRDKYLCLQCGKEFEPVVHLSQKFCCNECREMYYKSHPKPKAEVTGTCMNCGKSFVKKHGNQRYCSEKCKMEKNKKPHKEKSLQICKYCGKAYLANRATHIYCSEKCKNAAYREIHKEALEEKRKLLIERKLRDGERLIGKYARIATIDADVTTYFKIVGVLYNKRYSDVPFDKNLRWRKHKSPCLVVEAKNKFYGTIRIAASDCEIIEVRKNA